MSEALEPVVIESLGSGGAGVTHLPDGMIAFVPRTAPGDRVLLRAVKRRRRHAEAQIAEIVTPGPDRVAPACAHFVGDRCGGCQWQHISPDAQLRAKARIVGDALRRIGGLDVADPEVVASPRPSAYRTTVTLTVRWRGAHAVVGFHDAADPDRVFMLDRCEIARPELNALWQAVRPAAASLPKGDDVRLKLRLTPDGAQHVVVTGGEGAWMGGARLAKAALDAGIDATIWWQPIDGALRRVGGPERDAAAVAFAQVNAEVAVSLRDTVVVAAGLGDGGTGGLQDFNRRERLSVPQSPSPPVRILDLYAGSGDTALPLARAGCDVTMVEMESASVRRAETLAREAGVPLRCIMGRVEDQLAKLLPADVVIVNPPRAGLSEEVTGHLAALPPCRLIYVSCDPATLARDLKRLGIGAGQILLLKAWDMFPHTSHVETLLVADLRVAPDGAPAVSLSPDP